LTGIQKVTQLKGYWEMFLAPVAADLADWSSMPATSSWRMDKKIGRNGGRRFAPISYRLVTFAACRPLGPEVTSNSTAWPSFNDLYPSA